MPGKKLEMQEGMTPIRGDVSWCRVHREGEARGEYLGCRVVLPACGASGDRW